MSLYCLTRCYHTIRSSRDNTGSTYRSLHLMSEPTHLCNLGGFCIHTHGGHAPTYTWHTYPHTDLHTLLTENCKGSKCYTCSPLLTHSCMSLCSDACHYALMHVVVFPHADLWDQAVEMAVIYCHVQLCVLITRICILPGTWTSGFVFVNNAGDVCVCYNGRLLGFKHPMIKPEYYGMDYHHNVLTTIWLYINTASRQIS